MKHAGATEHLLALAASVRRTDGCCAETLLTFVSDTKRNQRCRLRPARNLRNPGENSGERKECPRQLSSKRQLTRVLPPVHITC